jgi:putative nucleotidyltransferase with HDIG domain
LDAVATARARSGPSPLRASLRRAQQWLEREQPPARITYSNALLAYVVGVEAIALVLAFLTVRPPADSAGLVIVSVTIALMAFFSVRAVSSVNTIFNASSFLHLGLSLTIGPIGALCGALAECTGIQLRYRTGVFRTVFNFALSFLTDLGAWAVFYGLQHIWSGGPLATGLAGLVTGFIHWGINYGVLSGTLAIATGRPVLEQMREGLPVSPYNLCYGYAAVGFVALHDRFGPLGFTFALAPVVALQVFLMVLARRTRLHETQRDHLVKEIQAQNIRVERSYDATLIALTHALDARDKETEGHSRRVVEYTRLVAVELGIIGEDLKLLCHGALLHDIGKIGVPDAILHKPGPLTEAEWQVMRRHPEIGALMVEEVEYLTAARRIILHHHERWDGRGYPFGLRGTQISMGARAFAVADTVDAITQDRPYRRGRSFDEAREELVRNRGSQFDPEAVDAFLGLDEAQLQTIAAVRARVGIDLLTNPSVGSTPTSQSAAALAV